MFKKPARKSLFITVITALLLFCSSCKSIHKIEQIPADTYLISTKQYAMLDTTRRLPLKQKTLKIDIELEYSILKLTTDPEQLKPLQVKLKEINLLQMRRYTFDVLTVPFKVRPSVKGFPEQKPTMVYFLSGNNVNLFQHTVALIERNVQYSTSYNGNLILSANQENG